MAGRYKLSDQGVYFDPNDTGPDQASPDQIQQYQQQQAPRPPDATGGYQPPTGGIAGGSNGGAPTPAPAPPSGWYQDTSKGKVIDPYMNLGPNGEAGIYPWVQGTPPPGYQPPSVSFDPSKASPTTGINGGEWNTNPVAAQWLKDHPGATMDQMINANLGGGNTGGITFDPSKASPTTGINGGGGAQQVPGASGVPTGGAVPAGFDATKWNDATKHDPKYDAGHMLAAGQSLEQIGQYIQQTYPGYKYLGGDKILGPDGATYDFSFGSGAGINAPQWTQVAGGTDSGAGGYGGSSGSIGSGAGGAGGIGGVGGAPTNSAFSDQVRQLLLGQISGLSGPVTANDPQIKAEMDAQDAALTRNQRDQRAAAAERMAMNGLLNGGQSSGAFDQELASEFENKGQQLTGLQAQLFGREIQQRRQLVLSYLQSALQSGDAESARQLQAYLAQLDNAYRYAALAQNQSQWSDQFGLNASQVLYNRDKDLASYGAGY